MSKPLSNLDYLINRKSSAPPPSASADKWVDESLVALATPILSTLSQSAEGKCSVFDLVDKLKVGVDNLRPVLDAMAGRFGWLQIDRSDLKGNYIVSLTPQGREQLQRVAQR